jgi:Amt family ammonium transporter
LSLGLFACGDYQASGSGPGGVPVVEAGKGLAGLFYGGGMDLLKAQIIGSAIICTATFTIAMGVFAALNAVGLLRISKDGEEEGMDLHEHGISAYPEYVISALAAPHGMPRDTVNYTPPVTAADKVAAAPSAAR